MANHGRTHQDILSLLKLNESEAHIGGFSNNAWPLLEILLSNGGT